MPSAVLLLSGGLDSTTLLAHALARRVRRPRDDVPLRPTACDRSRRRAPSGGGVRRARSRDRRHRSANIRRIGADERRGGAEGSRRRGATARRSPSRTCRRETRSFCRSRSRGPRCSSAERHFHRRECARLLGLSRLPARVHRGVRADGEPRDARRRRRHAIACEFAHRSSISPKRRSFDAGWRSASTTESPRAATTRPADGIACGHCDACQLRLKGFHDAGASDPAQYL